MSVIVLRYALEGENYPRCGRPGEDDTPVRALNAVSHPVEFPYSPARLEAGNRLPSGEVVRGLASGLYSLDRTVLAVPTPWRCFDVRIHRVTSVTDEKPES